MQEMKQNYLFFLRAALFYGVINTVCMYRNPAGISFPILVVVTLVMVMHCLNRVHKESFTDVGTKCYLVAIVLLAVSTCLTANEFFHFFNKAAILLLFSAMMLHQLYADGTWRFPTYLKNLFILWGTWLASIGCIFTHAVGCRGKVDSEYKKKTLSVLKGIGLAALILCVVLPLLISSDLIISNFFSGLWTIQIDRESVGVIVRTAAAVLLFYAFFTALLKKNAKEETVEETKRAESLIGITLISILSVIYVCYAAVQIIFLFLRAGVLPENLTYSQYAHEGFWQLLAVSIINIVLILVCMQVFTQHKMLNVLLLVISLCTCVMAASAAYRMLLYVQAYHLTFLRILVLWFLGVLVLMMFGMMRSIFRMEFPLFRYCMVVVTCCYILFSFVRVDAVIASYNIEHTETLTMRDVWYLTESLSADAAEYVAQIEPEMVSDVWDASGFVEDHVERDAVSAAKEIYFEKIVEEPVSFRRWNYSMMKARRVAEEYLRKADANIGEINQKIDAAQGKISEGK